ncbi:hypothetical protein HmCmsJML281_01840 [Escherichia coli]|nr:hypothetical protein HmCmsJML281_01840 [Escherichia coli]
MLSLVQGEDVSGQVAQREAKQHLAIFIHRLLAAGNQGGCLLTGNRDIKTDVGRAVRGSAQRIHHTAEKRAVLVIHLTYITEIPQTFEGQIKVFSFGSIYRHDDFSMELKNVMTENITAPDGSECSRRGCRIS